MALSPAVNDSTTAVQVLNHLGDVLRLIGTVDPSRSRWSGERGGRTGLGIPARSWEDYLALATTEIREYGGSAIQVMRRMRAMLLELRDEVPPEHRAAVEEELARLDATVARRFGDSVDLDRASTPDSQGIGGLSAIRADCSAGEPGLLRIDASLAVSASTATFLSARFGAGAAARNPPRLRGLREMSRCP